MATTLVHGHGRLMNPPARNAMWRFGFPNEVNYNDNELFCGGHAGEVLFMYNILINKINIKIDAHILTQIEWCLQKFILMAFYRNELN